jgi:hypothetical protein
MKLAHAVLVSTTLATSAAIAAAGHADAAKLPAEMVQGEVHYVSGGIGHDEAAAFRHAEKHYPLALVFSSKAKPRDEFVSDVKVMIRDAKGKTMLDAASTGPFLLARLPAGKYDIQATHGSKMLERHATVVEGKPMQLAFLWPAS